MFRKIMVRFIVPALVCYLTLTGLWTCIKSNKTTNMAQNAKICKAAIATMFSKHPSIILVDGIEGDMVRLSYVRSDDGTTWRYRCRISGDQIIWASDTGRWRTHPDDEKVTFKIVGNAVIINEFYKDGSTKVKTFYLSEL